MTRFDAVALAAVTAVAAVLRLPGLEVRGRFDADQGHDMLTLAAFVRDGVVPLLGPKTSVGEFHHGAFYYYLLAPSAAISNADPVAVTAFIALLGIGAVALTWWLGRAMGGPVAGLIAGMLLAVSPAAIEESTFIWNPNPIGFFAALGLAAAWRARTDGRAAWWAVAIGAAGAVTQLHVLGLVFLAAIVALGLLELRRTRARRIGLWLLGGLAVVAILFLPLLVHELQTGFSETRALLAYLAGDDEALANPVSALVFTLLRVVGWPLIGVVTDVPQLAAILLAVTIGLAVLGVRLARDLRRTALVWLLGLLAWSTIALAFAAPSLQRVVAGLPNDHYHAFLDPVVVLLIAIPAGTLFAEAASAWRQARRPMALAGVVLVGIGIVAIELVALSRKPPRQDPDGGWAAARAAGERIVQAAAGRPIGLAGIPDFKRPDGIGFPIEQAGGVVEPVDRTRLDQVIVVACDRLFETVVGAGCGGPAEDDHVDNLFPAVDPGFRLLDRFPASPRTSISIYEKVDLP